MARAPLTPADCNLQDFHRMMLDIPRLRGSEFDATIDDGAWRAGLNLWMSAWHHVPAASLPDDDGALAKAAGLGRDIRTWKKVKALALRGWVKCSDGLLYHPVIAELALEAWLDKLVQAISSGSGNARRWGGEFDPTPIEADIDQSLGMLAALNPKSKALTKAARRKSRPSSPRDPGGITAASHRESQNTDFPSQENRNGTDIEEPPNPPRGADEFSSFDEAFEAYPLSGQSSTKRPKAFEAWNIATQSHAPGRLIAAARAYAAGDYATADRGKRVPSFQRWLAEEMFIPWLPNAGQAAKRAWPGPPDVRAAIVAKMLEPWTISWLDRCRWRDLPDRAVLTDNAFVADTLRNEVGDILDGIGISILTEAAA